jgi:hypothetical protein
MAIHPQMADAPVPGEYNQPFKERLADASVPECRLDRRKLASQTNALNPVMALPTISVFISLVPS